MQNKGQMVAILDTIANELLKLRRLTKAEGATYTEETIPPQLKQFAQYAVIAGTTIASMKKLLDTK